MQEQFSVFYCSVCNICKKLSESSECMKFCSGCKLVQYCCIEHQKQDWCAHKEFCKGVQQIMKKMKMFHVYEDAEQLDASNLILWNNLRTSFIKLIEITLKRDLKPLELQICFFPPVCSYCHLYKPNRMFTCHGCLSKLFCCKEHQSNDSNHYSNCKLFRLGFDADMVRFKNPAFYCNFLSFVFHFCQINKLPENMEVVIKSIKSTNNIEGICISEPLSYTLTLIYVISKIAKITSNQLTLHIVGANSMEFLAVQTFPLIYHLLPHIIHLKIVLIGPTVESMDCIPLCLEPSNVCVSSVCMLYHEYVASLDFVAPDIIATLNCGISEFQEIEARDEWKDSLPSILSFKNTFVILTSYTEKESVADSQRLLRFKNKDVHCETILECQENPFGSLYPHRDWENEGVYYTNRYISVLKIG